MISAVPIVIFTGSAFSRYWVLVTGHGDFAMPERYHGGNASDRRPNSTTVSSSGRRVPAMPLAAKAAAARSSPNASPSERRNILHRVAYASFTTRTNKARTHTGASGAGRRD